MKYCDEFAALLDPYIDGELSPEETARVREHLRSCDGCRAYVQAALIMRDAFPEAEDTEVPDGFAEGVMAAIRADAAPRKRRRLRWRKTLLPLAACCAVVILAVSGLPRLDGNTADTVSPAAAEATVRDTAGEGASTEESAEAAAPGDDSGAERLPAAANAPEAEGKTDASLRTNRVVEDRSAGGEAREAVPAEHGGTPEAQAENSAAPAPYAAVSSPGLTLTAKEAGQLLDDYSPEVREDGTLVYTLTAEEYAGLLEQLEQQGMTVAGAATAEDAECAGTVLVHVIPD